MEGWGITGDRRVEEREEGRERGRGKRLGERRERGEGRGGRKRVEENGVIPRALKPKSCGKGGTERCWGRASCCRGGLAGPWGMTAKYASG